MKKRLSCLFYLGITLLLVSGCGVSYMQQVPANRADYMPPTDKALITFMRASRMAPFANAALFHVEEDTSFFIGTPRVGQKIAYQVEPGKHLFMINNGGAADFMKAEVEAGKNYYALVYPRYFTFGIKPVHKELLSSDQFKSWQSRTVYIEKKDEADVWDKANAARIQEQKLDKLDKWLSGPGRTEGRALQPEDGI